MNHLPKGRAHLFPSASLAQPSRLPSGKRARQRPTGSLSDAYHPAPAGGGEGSGVVPINPLAITGNNGPGVAIARFCTPGQGLYRLQQFSNALSSESESKHGLPWWNLLIQEYFMPDACLVLSLRDDNSRSEPKVFHVEAPALPRFFLSTAQSGVRSMSLTLSEPSPIENLTRPGRVSIDCPSAIWTFAFGNGYTTALCGPLTAQVVISPATMQRPVGLHGHDALKFEKFVFKALYHEKHVPAHGRAVELVNAYGIPQATMRCLELADAVRHMEDLIQFSNETGLGAFDALAVFGNQIRDGARR